MERQGTLRPQDIIVAIAYLKWGKETPQKTLAERLFLSPAEIVKSNKRLESSRLLDSSKKVDRSALLNFIKHGLRIAFPAQVGSLRKGIKTSLSNISLQRSLKKKPEISYVWESGNGKAVGQSVIPLYPGICQLARKDKEFYELISTIESIRLENKDVTKIAVKHLTFALR